jgi:hypothetical protein
MTDLENGGELTLLAIASGLALIFAALAFYEVRRERSHKQYLDKQARRRIAWDTHSPFCECSDCKEMPL